MKPSAHSNWSVAIYILSSGAVKRTCPINPSSGCFCGQSLPPSLFWRGCIWSKLLMAVYSGEAMQPILLHWWVCVPINETINQSMKCTPELRFLWIPCKQSKNRSNCVRPFLKDSTVKHIGAIQTTTEYLSILIIRWYHKMSFRRTDLGISSARSALLLFSRLPVVFNMRGGTKTQWKENKVA